MQITIDTNNLSELDIAMLGFLAGNTEVAETEEPEAPAPAPAPAKKAAAKAAPAAAKAEAPAPDPDPAPAPEADEDLVGGDAPTMADAVAAATVLVSNGGAAKVKEALAAVGAKRVSEMDEASIPAFLAAIADEG